MSVIPIICGPTGSGKSTVALELASRYPIEIVSADSRQLVRKLDIGTAKPSRAERERVPHHLLDLIEPGERYSAFRFIGDASRAIEQILKRGNLPLVVGGTGLYLRALTDGVVEIDEPDLQLRQDLEREAKTTGPEALHQRLMSIDPLEAARIHPNNVVKVIRALEIFHLTGRAKSDLAASGIHRKANYQFSYYCLSPDRPQLYERIDLRAEEMLRSGWIDEVRQLAAQGISSAVRSARIIGYSELLDVLEGHETLENAVTRIKQETRRYAKRQVTWFRHQTTSRFVKNGNELGEVLETAIG